MDDPLAPAQAFRLFVLNCAMRNGDAQVKNFGIVYDDVNGRAELAPAYDLVTTRAYLPADAMALTLNGSTVWPDRRKLVQLGQTRADLSNQEVAEILERTADALSDEAPRLGEYFDSRASTPENRCSHRFRMDGRRPKQSRTGRPRDGRNRAGPRADG